MLIRIVSFGRSRARSVRYRFGAAVAVAALALAITSPSWASTIVTYWNTGMMGSAIAETSGYASRDWNRVYRPGGYPFLLGYENGGTISWVGPDTWDNPFVDTRSATSARAECNNYSPDFVQNVTCQTTTP